MALSAGVVTGFFLVLMAAAGPAAAIDDPSRPHARVTQGPSCQPGGIVVELTGGTAAWTVRLATTRTPAGEDEAVLAAGGSAVLETGDVAPGETIDPRLEFTARDGSGTAYVDELADYTLTRPTTEDCQAATNPPANQPTTPPATPSATVEPTTPSSSPGTSTGPRSTTPSSSARPTTGATTNAPSRTSGPAGGATAGRPGTSQVAPGQSVTLRGAGFLPGERVDVLLRGTETVIATATADPEGQIAVDVEIPAAAEAGPATLDLVGADSAVSTGVQLQVAAAGEAAPGAGSAVSLASLVAAAVALVGATGGLVSVAGRQRTGRRGRHAVPTG
ncbi:hypothetical protein DQ237_10140 [Blastococcus sp. TF02-8]|uniref:hypothetical protein n=1 Tax=Blastococcus sp. TF02-8 TaxID=2250574 RepID=UPI000DE923B0|nr:hypothetical protein [Blastococcus sp. TF02-8]RBY96216.1 hypothetical protein DQ237_10140 [Blastococcus sp. TF02-8]